MSLESQYEKAHDFGDSGHASGNWVIVVSNPDSATRDYWLVHHLRRRRWSTSSPKSLTVVRWRRWRRQVHHLRRVRIKARRRRWLILVTTWGSLQFLLSRLEDWKFTEVPSGTLTPVTDDEKDLGLVSGCRLPFFHLEMRNYVSQLQPIMQLVSMVFLK